MFVDWRNPSLECDYPLPFKEYCRVPRWSVRLDGLGEIFQGRLLELRDGRGCPSGAGPVICQIQGREEA